MRKELLPGLDLHFDRLIPHVAGELSSLCGFAADILIFVA